MNIISIDTETGGFAGTSLLSIGLYTPPTLLADFEISGFKMYTQASILDIKVKPPDGKYIVEARALEINQINLVEHDKQAIPYKEAATLIYDCLHKWSNGGKNKLTVLGKNTYFDLLRIWEVISRNTWEQFCSYRVLDLNSALAFVKHKGHDLPDSLEALAKHFNIEHDAHTALSDAIVTHEVYKKLLAL